MRLIKIFLAVFGLLGSLNWNSIQAMTLIRQNQDQLIRSSDLICAAKVVSVEGVRDGKYIHTHAKIHPIQCFLGASSADIDVVWPGGKLKENGTISTTRVPGAPQIQADQIAIFFLTRPAKKSEFSVNGMSEGVVPLCGQATHYSICNSRMDLKAFAEKVDAASNQKR